MPPTRIQLTGLPRSGSTFIWQLLNSAIEDKPDIELLKMHGGLKGSTCEVIFSTYRDPRDILISAALSAGNRPKQPETLEAKLSYLDKIDWFGTYYEEFIDSFDSDRVFFIRYEDYLPNNPRQLFEYLLSVLYSKIDNFEKLSEEKIVCTLDKYKLKNNKKIADSLLLFDRHDRESNIYGGHITSDGKTGNWKGVLPKEREKELERYVSLLGYK